MAHAAADARRKISLAVLILHTLLGRVHTVLPSVAWHTVDRAGTSEIFNYPFAAARGPGPGQLCTAGVRSTVPLAPAWSHSTHAGYFEGQLCFGAHCLHSATHHGYLVARAEADGQVLWVQHGIGSTVWPTQMCATEQQQVVLVGRFSHRVAWGQVVLSAPAQAIFAVAFGADGVAIWGTVLAAESTNHTVPAAAGSRAVHWHDTLKASVCADGGTVYVAGSFRGSATWAHVTLHSRGGADTFVAALDALTGAVLWAASGGGARRDVARTVTAGAGLVYLGGEFSGRAQWGSLELASTPLMQDKPQWGDSIDAYCLAYNGTSGKVVWGWAAGGSAWDRGAALVFAYDGTHAMLLMAADAYGAPLQPHVRNASSYTPLVAGVSQWGAVTLQATQNDGTKPHSVLVAIDPSNGHVLWAQPSKGSSTVWSAAVQSGKMFVGGSYWGSAQWPGAAGLIPPGTGLHSEGESDGFVAAFDIRNGRALWAIGVGGAGVDHVSAISASGVMLLVTGFFYSSLILRGTGVTLKAKGGASAFVIELVWNHSEAGSMGLNVGINTTTNEQIRTDQIAFNNAHGAKVVGLEDGDWPVLRSDSGVAVSADHVVVIVPMLLAVCTLPMWWWRHMRNKLTD